MCSSIFCDKMHDHSICSSIFETLLKRWMTNPSNLQKKTHFSCKIDLARPQATFSSLFAPRNSNDQVLEGKMWRFQWCLHHRNLRNMWCFSLILLITNVLPPEAMVRKKKTSNLWMFFVFRCQPSKLYLQSCHQFQENLQTAKRWALLGELNWTKKTNTIFFSGHLFGMFGTTPKICQEYQEDLDASPASNPPPNFPTNYNSTSSGASAKLLRHRTWLPG